MSNGFRWDKTGKQKLMLSRGAVSKVDDKDNRKIDMASQWLAEAELQHPSLDQLKRERAGIIERGRSKNGGWTAKQLKSWGIKWPPFKGWRKYLIDNGFPKT